MNKIVSSSLIALVLLGLMVVKVRAQPLVNLRDSKEKVTIRNNFSYLEDVSNQYTLNDILEETTQQKFKPFPKTTPSLGYINHPIWIKLTIDNQHSSLEDWYLDVDYILLDTLEVYYQKDGSWQRHLLGDHIPVEDWPTPYRSFVAPIKAPSQATTHIYIRVNSTGSTLVPITIFSETQFIQAIGTRELLFGMMYGTLIVMLLYNLFLYLALGNKSYLYYCIYFIGFLAAQSAIDGHIYYYLYGEYTWSTHLMTTLGQVIGTIAALLFAMYFLETEKYTPKLHRVLKGFIIIVVLSTISILLLDWGHHWHYKRTFEHSAIAANGYTSLAFGQ